MVHRFDSYTIRQNVPLSTDTLTQRMRSDVTITGGSETEKFHTEAMIEHGCMCGLTKPALAIRERFLSGSGWRSLGTKVTTI